MCEKTPKNNLKLSCCGHFRCVRTDSGAGEIHRVTICSLVQNEIMELCIEIFWHKKLSYFVLQQLMCRNFMII